MCVGGGGEEVRERGLRWGGEEVWERRLRVGGGGRGGLGEGAEVWGGGGGRDYRVTD